MPSCVYRAPTVQRESAVERATRPKYYSHKKEPMILHRSQVCDADTTLTDCCWSPSDPRRQQADRVTAKRHNHNGASHRADPLEGRPTPHYPTISFYRKAVRCINRHSRTRKEGNKQHVDNCTPDPAQLHTASCRPPRETIHTAADLVGQPNRHIKGITHRRDSGVKCMLGVARPIVREPLTHGSKPWL